MKKISIRMKTTKDTRKECNRRGQMWQLYFEGKTPPHFPVPALPIRVVHSKWRIWCFLNGTNGLAGKYLASWRYYE